MDSWRILHPSGLTFSYYSKLHYINARIDLLCVDHFTLASLQLTSIENITILDNASITVILNLPEGTRRSRWLNENLLDDTAVVSGVTEVLTHYLRGIVCESHKAVRRRLAGWTF